MLADTAGSFWVYSRMMVKRACSRHISMRNTATTSRSLPLLSQHRYRSMLLHYASIHWPCAQLFLFRSDSHGQCRPSFCLSFSNFIIRRFISASSFLRFISLSRMQLSFYSLRLLELSQHDRADTPPESLSLPDKRHAYDSNRQENMTVTYPFGQ